MCSADKVCSEVQTSKTAAPLGDTDLALLPSTSYGKYGRTCAVQQPMAADHSGPPLGTTTHD